MNQDTGGPAAQKIGLIGGLALRAGIFYYEEMLRRFVAADRRLDLVLSHADVKTVLAGMSAGDKAGLGTYLGTLANELFDAGAGVVAITAVAPHLAIEEVARVARGPIINVLDVIPRGLEAAGIDRVAVFGNRAVVETNVFRTIPDSMAVTLDPAVIDLVHTTYDDIALCGKRGSGPEVEILEGVARRAMGPGGAQAILLAGTDLSSFYAGTKPTFPSIDVAKLHIDQIIAVAQGR